MSEQEVRSVLVPIQPADFGPGSLMYRLSAPQQVRGVTFQYVVTSIGDSRDEETQYAVFPCDEEGRCLNWGLSITHLANEGIEPPDWVWELGD
jgi:hypothetical protein